MPNFYGSSCQLKMNNRCRRVAINLTDFSQTAALNVCILFLFNYMFQKSEKNQERSNMSYSFSLLKNMFSLILVICITFIYFIKKFSISPLPLIIYIDIFTFFICY